jgi:hypothetical protein
MGSPGSQLRSIYVRCSTRSLVGRCASKFPRPPRRGCAPVSGRTMVAMAEVANLLRRCKSSLSRRTEPPGAPLSPSSCEKMSKWMTNRPIDDDELFPVPASGKRRPASQCLNDVPARLGAGGRDRGQYFLNEFDWRYPQRQRCRAIPSQGFPRCCSGQPMVDPSDRWFRRTGFGGYY